jgi:hypothetical protein
MLQDNTYGLMMTAAAPRLPTFLNFFEICLDRSPAMRGASSQGNRIEPKLLFKNPQETCFKALF